MSTPSARTPSEKARDELDARLAHVPGHEDLGGAGEAGHGAPDGEAHVRVELVGHRATHVVRLEDLVHPAHRATTIGGGPDGLRTDTTPGTAPRHARPARELSGSRRSALRWR